MTRGTFELLELILGNELLELRLNCLDDRCKQSPECRIVLDDNKQDADHDSKIRHLVPSKYVSIQLLRFIPGIEPE